MIFTSDTVSAETHIRVGDPLLHSQCNTSPGSVQTQDARTKQEGTMNSGQGEEKPPALGLEEGKGRHTGELQPFTPSKGVQRAGGLQQDSPHRLGSEKGNTLCSRKPTTALRGFTPPSANPAKRSIRRREEPYPDLLVGNCRREQPGTDLPWTDSTNLELNRNELLRKNRQILPQTSYGRLHVGTQNNPHQPDTCRICPLLTALVPYSGQDPWLPEAALETTMGTQASSPQPGAGLAEAPGQGPPEVVLSEMFMTLNVSNGYLGIFPEIKLHIISQEKGP